MATKISQIYTLITADDKPFKRGLESARGEAVRGAKRIQTALSKINFKALALGTAAIAASLGYATKKFIDAAAEQEAVEKRLAAVLKSTGQAAGYNIEQLKAMAAQMQRVTTTGDEVILSGMAILATFKHFRGEAFQRATMAALDLSEVLSQDLQTSILQIAKALNDPISNLGALGRAGIQFTKDQKEMIKSLWESGRAAEAQNIILTEMESQFGGTARAARDAFGGAVKSLNNDLGDIGETIGFAVIKPLNNLVIRFRNWIETNDELLKQDLPGLITKIGNAASKTFEIIGRIDDSFDVVFGGKLTGTIKEKYLETLQDQKRDLENYLVVLETLEQEESDQYRKTQQRLKLTNEKIALTEKEIEQKKRNIQLDKTIAAAFKEQDEAAKKVTGTLKTFSEQSSIPVVTKQTKELDQALEHLNQRNIERASIWDVEFRHAQEVEGQYERTAEELGSYTTEAEKKANELEEAYNSTTYSMEGALTNFVTTGKVSFADLINSMLNDLARLGSSKIFQAIGGSLFGGGSTLPITSTIRGGEGGGYGFQGGGFIGERVRGVGMASGKSYEFHPNEFVIPNKGIGGSNVEVIVNNYSGQPIERSESIGPDNTKRIEMWIGNSILSRGPIHKAIQSSFYVAPKGRSL